MIANLSRGGLRFPQPCTVHMVLVMAPVVEKLTKGENAKPFLASNNQRGIVSFIATSLLGDVELETCENGHTSKTLARHIGKMVKSSLALFLVAVVACGLLCRTDGRLLDAKSLTDPVTGLLDNTVQARELTEDLVPGAGKKALGPLSEDSPSPPKADPPAGFK
ncbi:hypothetical protein HPB49_004072 [Dermacentor silvarum]|uniref:Uncharacterized protein n=1 Tax=Dermacentor silvarum TaxID=543639 RepID=A0ACB8DAQ7_DERSI|nr:hypothetical protein HPB49_004072 [Dermacentor silvarum]